jgi:hypothetical protein
MKHIYIQVDANSAGRLYCQLSKLQRTRPANSQRSLRTMAHNAAGARQRESEKHTQEREREKGSHRRPFCRMYVFAPWARTHKVWGRTLLLIAFHTLHPFKVHLPSAAAERAQSSSSRLLRQWRVRLHTYYDNYFLLRPLRCLSPLSAFKHLLSRL